MNERRPHLLFQGAARQCTGRGLPLRTCGTNGPAKDVRDPVFAGRTANGPAKNVRDPVFAGRTANDPTKNMQDPIFAGRTANGAA
jgi:hypothetical protein